MLEKTAQELLGGQGECFHATVVAAAEAEGDPVVFIAHREIRLRLS